MISFNWDNNIECLDAAENHLLYEEQDDAFKKYFNQIDYFKICADTFSKIEPVKVLKIYHHNEIVGLWMFRETSLNLRKIKSKFWVPVTFRIAEYNLPIIKKGQEVIFFAGLELALADHSIFIHNLLPFHSLWFVDHVKGSFVYNSSYNPVLENNQSSAILEASQKKGLVRDYKALKKKYQTNIIHYIGDIKEEKINNFFALHIKRWKADGIKSKFTQPEFVELYLKLSNFKVEGVGIPVLSEVIVDNQLMAMHFGFIIHDVFLYQIPAFDPEFKKLGPGTILLKALLDLCVERKVRSFDMGYGVEKYKFRYMNSMLVYESVLRHKNKVLNFLYRIKI